MEIKLNIISTICSLREIFLLCSRPTKQKEDPTINEIINEIVQEVRSKVRLK